ncbi:MAG: hypothetical protein ACTHYN_10445 [Marinobacter sp.]|uniref:hypothetical protein n=1 Tax=Marinobacter sp. TaxID=50741 RepID=UPI003F9A0997
MFKPFPIGYRLRFPDFESSGIKKHLPTPKLGNGSMARYAFRLAMHLHFDGV